jgi:hypothetical protein
MADVLFKNQNYIVNVGPSMVLEDAMVYHAVNIETGVIEAEEHMLPRIVEYAQQLNEAVEDLRMQGLLKTRSPLQ